MLCIFVYVLFFVIFQDHMKVALSSILKLASIVTVGYIIEK